VLIRATLVSLSTITAADNGIDSVWTVPDGLKYLAVRQNGKGEMN
jgi:hypothetical protein